MSEAAPFISFPEGFLGSRPRKFELLTNRADCFAVNKPAGMACYQHDWALGRPDFSMALRRSLLEGKPQLARLGIEGVFRVYNLEAEASGALLYAKTEEAEARYRNAFGAEQMDFLFHLLVRPEGEDPERVCALPVARHFEEPRMAVSHKTGKKCETRFRRLRRYGPYELWEARSRQLRLHQVRLHAAESGLRIVGDPLYGANEQLYLSRIKRDYRPGRRPERPLRQGLCLHLLRVEAPAFGSGSGEALVVQAPLHKGFAAALSQLARRSVRPSRREPEP